MSKRFKSKERGCDSTRKISFKQSNAGRHLCPKQKWHMERMRHRLATVLVCSVGAVALAAVFVARADEILSKLLPALMLVLGYYFGSRR